EQDAPALAIEGALRLDIDRARGRVRIDIGADRLRYLDRVDRTERQLFEAEGARARGPGHRIDARQADAVQRHRGIFGGKPPQLDVAHRTVAIAAGIGVDPRHELDEFARIAVGDVAIGFGRQAVLDVHRLALAHDRARVALADADHDDLIAGGETFVAA